MQQLEMFLKKEIRENKDKIQKAIDNFEKEKAGYRNIDINENVQLILRKEGFEKLMLIGFPFPLESYPLNGFKTKKETLVFIFLRGEKIRSFQKKQLLDELREIAEISYLEIESVNT